MHFQTEDLNEHSAAEVENNVICWDFSRNLILYIYMFFPMLLKRLKEAEDALKNFPVWQAGKVSEHTGLLKENIPG